MANEQPFSLNEGFANIIKGSTTKMAATVATFVAGVDAFNNGNLELANTLKTWGKTFTIASLVGSLEKMISKYNDARLELTRTFGLTGQAKFKFLETLKMERQELLLYGGTLTDSLDVAIGLVTQLGSLNILGDRKELIQNTILISKAFNVTSDAAAELSGAFALFQNMGAQQIQTILGSAAMSAKEAGVSTRAMFDNLRGVSNMMYLFNLKADGARERLNAMAINSTLLGVNMGSAIQSVQEFRDAGAAVRASADFSAFGLNIGASALMGMAFNPDTMNSVLLNVFSQMQGMNRNQQIGAAKRNAGAFGMSQDEFMGALKRAETTGIDKLIGLEQRSLAGDKKATAQLKEISASNMGFSERLDAFVRVFIQKIADPLSSFLIPLTEKLFDNSENIVKFLQDLGSGIKEWLGPIVPPIVAIGKWIGQHGTGFGRLIVVLGGIALLVKGISLAIGAKEAIGGFIGGAKGLVGRGVGGAARAAGNIPGQAGVNMHGGAGMFGKITGKGMLQGAAGMLAISAAMWVMSKALLSFETLEHGWETFALAAASMVAFGLIAAGLGTMIGPLLLGSIAIAALGPALASFGWGLGVVTTSIDPLLGHGGDLKDIGLGLAAIFASMMLLPGGAIGGALGRLFGGSTAFIKPLESLVKFATDENVSRINKLGEAVMKVGTGLEKISSSSLTGLQASISTAGASGNIPLQAHIRVDVSGQKLLDIIENTRAGNIK